MRRVVLPVVLASTLGAAPAQAQDRDVIYQMSTLGALQVGLYQPALSVRDLRDHGDFGLGTFAGLNGEMIVDRGTVYQVPDSGVGRVARGGWESPFAVVTHFDIDQRFRVSRQVDLSGLGAAIDRRLGTLNTFYAIRVTGRFAAVQTRSVARQPRPYPPLSAAVAEQRTFDLRRVQGTMVGIRSPAYVGSLNVPGYHWHFISADGRQGGHVLSLTATNLRVAADRSRHWQIELPSTRAFRNAQLG